jgi:CRP-like cAMP-binding protein
VSHSNIISRKDGRSRKRWQPPNGVGGLSKVVAPRSFPTEGAWRDGKLEVLAGLALFGGCSHKQLVRLGRITELARVQPGGSVLTQGDLYRWWVVIASGSALVLRDDLPLAVLGPGDWCGEGPIVRRSPSEVSLVAMTPMEIVLMDGQRFLELPYRFPEVATYLVRTLSARSFQFFPDD